MTRDPWWLQRWAREQKVGNATRKLLLQLIAEACDYNTAACRPRQETLAEWAETSPRTVYGHLNALEEAGFLRRRRRHRVDGKRAADEFILLAPGVAEWPDGAPLGLSEDSSSGHLTSSPSEVQASEHGQPPTDQPHREGVRARARVDSGEKVDPRDQAPPDFPDELRPHAAQVMRILTDVAVQHGARAVRKLAVGRAMMAFPRRPHVAVAHELAIWAADPPRPVRDVVSTYRTFLERGRDLAGPERLDGEGAAPLPANVTRLPGNATAAERRREGEGNLARRLMSEAGIAP